MPEPPFQNDMRSQSPPPRRPHMATGFVHGSPAVLLVTSAQQIPAVLARGITERRPVLIDIPAFQWRASLLATVQKWSGKFGWWLVLFLVSWWLGHWLDAQLPNQDYLVPDWAKFDFVRQPDHKIILSPHEE
jgi:hypothetical protein